MVLIQASFPLSPATLRICAFSAWLRFSVTAACYWRARKAMAAIDLQPLQAGERSAWLGV